MQTTSISSPLNLLNGTSSGKTVSSENDGPAFGQVLSREVAERKNSETPRAPEGKQDKHADNQAAKTDGEAKPAGPTTKDAAHKEEASKTESTDQADAATASADVLAMVAHLAELQKREGGAVDASADLPGARKQGSPFADIHATIGAAANHGTQSKPDGSWAAQLEGGLQIDAGDSLQGDGELDRLTGKAGANGDFTTALKDAGSLAQTVQPQALTQAAQAQAQATLAGDKLTPRVGTPGWDQALGQKVVWMVNGDQQSASLTLNPPDLGPLKVVLQVTNAQATASFVAAQPEVRQALEAALPRLREMLGEAGIQLGHASVDSGSPQEQHSSERQSGHARGSGTDAGQPGMQVTNVRAPSGISGQGLVDTFA